MHNVHRATDAAGGPLLVELLEQVAGVMELDRGRHRLELIFEDGRLREWWAHAERRPAPALGVYDKAWRAGSPLRRGAV